MILMQAKPCQWPEINIHVKVLKLVWLKTMSFQLAGSSSDILSSLTMGMGAISICRLLPKMLLIKFTHCGISIELSCGKHEWFIQFAATRNVSGSLWGAPKKENSTTHVHLNVEGAAGHWCPARITHLLDCHFVTVRESNEPHRKPTRTEFHRTES